MHPVGSHSDSSFLHCCQERDREDFASDVKFAKQISEVVLHYYHDD